MHGLSDLLEDLSLEQQAACEESNNILLTACPGSGKTRTLTRKLAYQALKEPLSHRLNIAITYTNRAADEITNRLSDMGVDLENIWTGTIHQFCMKFIIRPYGMYSERLSKGYTIIDEFKKEKYGQHIASELGMNLSKYVEPFDIPKVVEKYELLLAENKEIDFEMILSLSDKLLTCCPFISTNISAIVNSILVDEFQDTNELQYTILSKIYKTNKDISLTFVGDPNQAIYGNLGGCAKCKEDLEELFGTTFKKMALTGCYRSTQRLVDLYRHFEVSKTSAYSVAKIKNTSGQISYSKDVSKDELAEKVSKIILEEFNSGRNANDICILAPQWWLLQGLLKKLRLLRPNIAFNAPDISPIKSDPLNPLYLLAKLLFMPAGKNVPLRKRTANEFISIIRDDFKIKVPENIQSYDILLAINHCKKVDNDGIECLKRAIESVACSLKIDIAKEEKLRALQKNFFEKIDDRVMRLHLSTDYDSICKCFREKEGIVVSTIHGVKGEEYTTVIAIGLLEGYLPNWDYILKPEMKPYRKNETLKLLYVLCSRAKENLYLFSETGHRTKKKNEYCPTQELIEIFERLNEHAKFKMSP